MVPVPITTRHSSRLLYILLSAASNYAPRFLQLQSSPKNGSSLARRASEFDPHDPKSIVFVVLIPILVLSSGLFAGLTLGYMSLDETQLNVLSISGTPDQRKYANKIKPIRKNGHLLLVTLLLANMIVNESLPVIADPILGGGIQSVVVSTVLIVIFAEIIPQSLFTRHGLYLGAKLAGFTKILIYVMGVVAWPVAKLLEFVLGSHHGIIYRRAELKELIAMHSSQATHGGDLKTDTVTIIGATLDLQEKVVRQAMTPIEDVFMLSIESKLDYALLKKICQTGHSRVPVYEEIEVPTSVIAQIDPESAQAEGMNQRMQKVKKIIGILLVKQCVLLDPKDATPLRKIPLNKVPFVPNNEPLLGILDRFQEGRSHMAIVSRFSVEKAASVKKAVKRGLTQRLRKRVGMDTDSDSDSTSEEEKGKPTTEKRGRRHILRGRKHKDLEEGIEDGDTMKDSNTANGSKTSSNLGHESEKLEYVEDAAAEAKLETLKKSSAKGGKMSKITGFQLPKVASAMTSMSLLEQDMPADAVLAKKGAAEFLQGFDPAVMPMGIITLEDVLEELIGEEIYDEFDDQGAHGDPYEVPPAAPALQHEHDHNNIAPSGMTHGNSSSRRSSINQRPSTNGSGNSHGNKLTMNTQLPTLKGLGFFRTRSAPPIPRDPTDGDPGSAAATGEKTVRINEGANIEIGPGDLAYQHIAIPSVSSPASPASIVMPRPVRGVRSPPSVILEQHSSVSSDSEGDMSLLAQAPADLPRLALDGRRISAPSPVGGEHSSVPLPATVGLSASAGASPKVPSRTASPAPSPALEAILLDRRRRLHGGGGSPSAPSTGSSSAAHTPFLTTLAGGLLGGATASLTAVPLREPSVTPVGTPAPSIASGSSTVIGVPGAGSKVGAGTSKGTRFKSSPLGGGERAGMVVAEQLNAAYAKDERRDGEEQLDNKV